jgi:predicted alpha/beta superfamily hydrolase
MKSKPDTWSIDLTFESSIDGYSCFNCTENQPIPLSSNLEYRIMTSKGTDMIGANFGLALTLSRTERYFSVREFECFPYFFTRNGNIRSINVTSADSFIQTRQWVAYFPASFEENTFKMYRTAIAFDMSLEYMSVLAQYVQQDVITRAIAEEVVMIGSGDYHVLHNSTDTDRNELLTPVPGAGFACKEGGYEDYCSGCIPVGTPPREYQELMRDKCGVPIFGGGRGESYLNHTIYEVLPAFQLLSNGRLLLDRDNLAIGGCSSGGLMACHALWTRPEIFGFGSCQSASFFWPMVDHITLDNGFEFLNKTLKTLNGPRLPQKIYIDVSESEDNPYYAQLGAAVNVFDAIAAASPQFRKDDNLLFVLADGGHCDGAMGRSWMWASSFNKPAGGSRNPNPPVMFL